MNKAEQSLKNSMEYGYDIVVRHIESKEKLGSTEARTSDISKYFPRRVAKYIKDKLEEEGYKVNFPSDTGRTSIEVKW